MEEDTKEKIIDKFDEKYDFLSNFYPCDISVKITDSEQTTHEIAFTSTEALYQASKLFYTSEIHVPTPEEIESFKAFAAMTPFKAKKAGRKIPINTILWDLMKVEVMTGALKLKFSDPVLAEKLKQTKNAILIEGNTWNDRYWGVCDGVGENMLGKLLMDLRYQLFQKPLTHNKNKTMTK